MALVHHIKAEQLIQQSRDHPNHRHTARENADRLATSYASRYDTEPIPKFTIPSKGVDGEVAYQMIHDELALDGNQLLNLASFVHTWMPDSATKLYMENVSKNLIDEDEYPMTQIIHQRCISMLANLWHAQHSKNAIGTATTGSSEAIQLGGLAMKKIWQKKMKAAGKDIHNPGPNIVMGANAQVALEKFARYFDVECRLVPVTKETNYCMSAEKAMEYVDENTIGVYVILGSTYTGHYEPVAEMCKLLDEYQQKTGHDVPVHVDGASGAFVAPFATPKLVWDFRLPRVVSINTSGHKFGLAYVGVGWVIWKDRKYLPDDLVFKLTYLGSEELSFSLNFSRPAAPIIVQYHSLLNLGWDGYRKVALNDLKNARLLARALDKSGYYHVVSTIHHPKPGCQDDGEVESYIEGLPVVAYHFSDELLERCEHLKGNQKWIQTLLRAKGWISPNYALPPELEKQEILRVVVRENMSQDLIDRYVTDLMEITENLIKQGSSASVLATLSSSHSHAKKERDVGKVNTDGAVEPTGYARQC